MSLCLQVTIIQSQFIGKIIIISQVVLYYKDYAIETHFLYYYKILGTYHVINPLATNIIFK